MVRLVLKWLDSPWAIELLPGLNTLGRNPTNDFRISDSSVSSFHAEIAVTAETIRVRDLGSTNGTFIDEQRIEEGLLRPEHILKLGNVRLQLDEVAVAPAPQPAPAAAPILTAEIDLHPPCMHHPDRRAAFKCENCAGTFCLECVTVLGEGKFGAATTVCPVCQGQCNSLAAAQPRGHHTSFLARLTQTLKIPFIR